MTWNRPTYRTVDGERIDGVWCHVWVEGHAGYYPADLFVYADGAVGCGELTDLQGLRQQLATGRIVLRDPREAPAEPARQRPRWSARYPEPRTDESFLHEVRDQIEALNGRPTTSALCWAAIRRYQQEPTEDNRLLVRDAYLAIPAHRRVFVLGDMDRQDIPLRQLVTPVGERVCGDGPVATPEMYQQVLDYFNAGDRGVEREQQHLAVLHADDRTEVASPTLVLREVFYPSEVPPPERDLWGLRNEYPARFSYRGQTYRTITHAYWAVAAAERADHDRIRDAPTPREAHEIGGQTALRPDWAVSRTAVMAALLRAKFSQHPRLAALLMSTGSAVVSYTGISASPFWTDRGSREGRNWIGRLLELVRSELAAAGDGHPEPN